MDNPTPEWPVPADSPPVRVVVLEHSVPDGSVHWDLLVARGTRAEALLWGIRCMERPDRDGSDIAIEAMPDHRPAWLRLEGEVSGGRGVVRRVASGLLERHGNTVIIQWSDGRTSEWSIVGMCLRPGPGKNARG